MTELSELPNGIPIPPAAYVPGQGTPPEKAWFDPLRASAPAGATLDEIAQSTAWAAGCAYLQAGYFWECHEVLEVVWTRTPEGSAERDLVQALIQLANARMKQRMRRTRAAARLCAMVRAQLARCPSDRPVLGLDMVSVRQWVTETENALKARYVSGDAP